VKSIDCKNCGSKDLVEDGAFLVCAYCRSRFADQAENVQPGESSVGVAEDIQALLKKCEQEPWNRKRYVALILDIDPTNREARHYL